MDVTMQNVYVNIPQADMKFFRTMVKKMGWVIVKPSKKKSGIDMALEDVEKGRVYKAASVDDLFR